MSDLQPTLSAAGERRRQQILRLAVAEGRRRRGRQVLARVTAVAVLVAALVPALIRIHAPNDTRVAVQPPRAALVVPAPQQIAVTRIETDPHILERLTIPPTPVHVPIINDRELLDDLAQAHHPAALAYVNGRAMLLYR